MSTYPPPVALPPTSNTLSSDQRAALVRSTRKLSKVLGDVPRVPDNAPTSLSRTTTTTSFSSVADAESTWSKRKPTHLPPLLKLSTGPIDDLDSPVSLASPYHRPPARRGSVLSIAPSIVSNAPSVASGSSEGASSDAASLRRTKLERLRRKLGDDVPATAVFPTIPRTVTASTTRVASTSKSTSRERTRSVARLPSQADDARSVAFSISSDESVHTVTFTAARVRSSPHPHKTKHVYQTGPLPPIPPLPAHLSSGSMSSSSRHNDDDDVGLIRPRQKMAAGSKIGGSDFKAARRAKREAKAEHGLEELGELMEMVGFMRF